MYQQHFMPSRFCTRRPLHPKPSTAETLLHNKYLYTSKDFHARRYAQTMQPRKKATPLQRSAGMQPPLKIRRSSVTAKCMERAILRADECEHDPTVTRHPQPARRTYFLWFRDARKSRKHSILCFCYVSRTPVVEFPRSPSSAPVTRRGRLENIPPARLSHTHDSKYFAHNAMANWLLLPLPSVLLKLMLLAPVLLSLWLLLSLLY